MGDFRCRIRLRTAQGGAGWHNRRGRSPWEAFERILREIAAYDADRLRMECVVADSARS
jgi:hypothetical protein